MEIAVISGKGGTGKSSISAAFATLNENIILADCDVDAANQYLIFQPENQLEKPYISGYTAIVDSDICSLCGICAESCRFDAITVSNNKIVIDEVSCDGCKLCSRICPTEAIHMEQNNKSRMYSGTYRNGFMVYGRLSAGEENSGKLVDMVRDEARRIQQLHGSDIILLDGPPGIGCPVISTITGVDKVVIVTEPTLSGLHDLKRTIEVVRKLRISVYVLVNKYDLNEEMAKTISRYCKSEGITLIANIPFDTLFTEAMVSCKSVIELDRNAKVSQQLIEVYNLLIQQN